MYCHRVKNPKFHDVCVLGSNTLIFALRGPDFKISAGGHALDPARNSHIQRSQAVADNHICILILTAVSQMNEQQQFSPKNIYP